MLNKVEGFEVEVVVTDGIPHVSIRFANGKPVLETAALSVTGLEHMAAVLFQPWTILFDAIGQRECQHEAIQSGHMKSGSAITSCPSGVHARLRI